MYRQPHTGPDKDKYNNAGCNNCPDSCSLFGIFNFGLRALLVILVTILSCMVTEHVYCKLMKIKSDPWDYSDVLTGLLLGLNLPVSIPYWMAILGGIFAILIVDAVWRFGTKLYESALAARVFLFISSQPECLHFWLIR